MASSSFYSGSSQDATNVNAVEDSKNAAALSEAAAAASATASANSAASGASSASTASTKASESSVSATASATSAAASQVSRLASEAARDAAAVSQAAAATSTTNAASSEGVATAQAGIATTKASESAVSAAASEVSRVAAAASQVASSNSQVAAASSAASAAAVFDQFDDTYLGSKTTEPTVDNDGNALLAGSLYYNSATGGMLIWSGTEWIAASAAGGASLNNFSFTASANQTTFSGSDDNSNTLSYVQDNLIVVLNGVILEAGTDYTATNGSSIILSSGAAANDELNVVAFKSFTTADMVSSSNGGTFYNNVDFSAGIDVTGNITVTGTVDGRDVAADGALAASAVQPGDLATVATSGSFNDLSNKPSPFDPSTLATVATSGAYSDLSGTPTLGTAAATAATAYATAAQGALAASATQPGDLATVATSGAYSDLSGTPTLGTAAATASSDYATAAQGATADAALPKSGGSMTGVIAGFQSTGIDDNASSTAMTLDTSGKLLVGKASASFNTTGVEADATDGLYSTRNGLAPLSLNRLTSDGDIVNLYKDGSVMGSIGADDGRVYIESSGGANLAGIGFSRTAVAVEPRKNSGWSNAEVDIGSTTYKFKDAHFSGTVNAANFNTTSDATLKTNVETLSGSLDAVKSLRGVSFDWLDNGGSEIGVIAQEVEAVLPDLVSTNDEGIKSVKYGNIVAVLIEAVKEQQAQIDELKAKLNS